jgi:hypothetical protein
MVTRLTEHAKRRLSDRLADLITADEVATKVASQTALPMGRTYLVLKQVEYTEIHDADCQPDGIARGDRIVAAVNRYPSEVRVVTVMLRKSWSKSMTYSDTVDLTL